MSRRVGQIVALFSLFALIVVVVAYQFYDQQRLRGDVLTGGYNGTMPVCGNTLLEDQEQCDDGNLLIGDGCDDQCQTEVSTCGNGVLDAGENCDDGNAISGDGCSSDCNGEVLPVCGDSMIEGSEQCDDGNAVSGDGCDDLCQIEVAAPVCGDLLVEAGEQCDDGNAIAGDGCSDTCQTEVSLCGNGVLDAGEQCDDRNTVSGDGCDAACQGEVAPVCGNGVLELGEECDFRDPLMAQQCNLNCLLFTAACGNTVVDPGEQCDDGNTVSGDGCDSSCQNEVPVAACGNSSVEGSEQCDDGNRDGGDGCSPDCVVEQALPTVQTTTSALNPNVPTSTRVENGQIVNEYFALYGERTVLDGLQVTQYVPSLSTEVRWSADSTNTLSVSIEDADAARTSFVAPSQEGQVSFVLEVKQQDQFVPVAKFVFRVVSPALYAADANKDGVYDFSDLLDLLQKWETYGSDATQILAIILSRYQE
ncbi:MAG: DUF4215 domain-containing protein [Candidatus Altimarinota bacterium]